MTSAPVNVTTSFGKLEGFVDDKTGASTFLGVPFAAAERFGPPLPPQPWQGIKLAKQQGKVSVQQDGIFFQPAQVAHWESILGKGIGAEGCVEWMSETTNLNLNIWSPNISATKLPVLFWIHGGAYFVGSGSELTYNGTKLCKRGGCVVVTINYRLDGFGFLWKPGSDLMPNCGTLDQLAALRWVQSEISAFGGDPHNVTLCGQSAGGQSVASIMGSPLGKGLFHKAICQSGGAHAMLSPAHAEETARMTAKELGISFEDEFNLATLRALPVSKLLDAFSKVGANMMHAGAASTRFGGTLYSCFLPVMVSPVHPGGQSAFAAILQGLNMSVPLLIGVQKYELEAGQLISPLEDLKVETVESMLKAPGQFQPPQDITVAATRIVHGLSERRNSSLIAAQSAWNSDRLFYLPSVRMADAHSRHNMGRTFFYEFSFGTGEHGLDVYFTWGWGIGRQIAKLREFPMEAVEHSRKVIETMQGMIFRFMRTGDPSGGEVGYFPYWTLEEPHVISIGTPDWNPSVSLVKPIESRVDEHRKIYSGIWEIPLMDVHPKSRL